MSSKGYLGIGAGGDLAVVDLATADTVMSFAMGQPILMNGKVVGRGGTLMITPEGEAICQKELIPYKIVYPETGWFYERRDGKEEEGMK